MFSVVSSIFDYNNNLYRKCFYIFFANKHTLESEGVIFIDGNLVQIFYLLQNRDSNGDVNGNEEKKLSKNTQ